MVLQAVRSTFRSNGMINDLAGHRLNDTGGRGLNSRTAPLVAQWDIGQHHHDRADHTVAQRLALRVQSAFGAPDTSGKIQIFKRLAAVRCTLRRVTSIMIRYGLRLPCRFDEDAVETARQCGSSG